MSCTKEILKLFLTTVCNGKVQALSFRKFV